MEVVSKEKCSVVAFNCKRAINKFSTNSRNAYLMIYSPLLIMCLGFAGGVPGKLRLPRQVKESELSTNARQTIQVIDPETGCLSQPNGCPSMLMEPIQQARDVGRQQSRRTILSMATDALGSRIPSCRTACLNGLGRCYARCLTCSEDRCNDGSAHVCGLLVAGSFLIFLGLLEARQCAAQSLSVHCVSRPSMVNDLRLLVPQENSCPITVAGIPECSMDLRSLCVPGTYCVDEGVACFDVTLCADPDKGTCVAGAVVDSESTGSKDRLRLTNL